MNIQPLFLKVKIVQATNLPKTDPDSDARCDAFLCLELGGQKAQTTHVSNSYDPLWNQKFTFRLKQQDETAFLDIVLFDKDEHLNELVGTARIPISKRIAPGLVTLNLMDPNGRPIIGHSGQMSELIMELEVEIDKTPALVRMKATNAGQFAMIALNRSASRSTLVQAEEKELGPLLPLPPRTEENQSRSQMNHPIVELPFERARRMRNLSPAADTPAEGAMWMDKAFVGEFGDAFVQDTSLEGGHIGPSITTFVRIAKFVLEEFGSHEMPLFSDADKVQVLVVLEKLEGAHAVSVELNEARRRYPESDTFSNFILRRVQQLKDLAVGDFAIWPGGWMKEQGGHAIMHIIDKTSASEVSFVTCNTGAGVHYHPADGTGYPKTKRKTAFRINGVPLDRLADPALLYVFWRCQLVGHEDHRPEVLYEVVLPHLAGGSLCVAASKSEREEAEYAGSETLQRSGVCYYRCILCATRHSLRRQGLSQPHVKQLLHLVRRGYVVMVERDLERCKATCSQASKHDVPELPGLFPSDLRLILLACQQLAYSAVKESEAHRMSLPQLKALHAYVGQVKTKAVELPLLGEEVDMEDPSAPGSCSTLLCDVPGLAPIKQTVRHACDEWAGEETAPPAEPRVNMLLVPDAVPADLRGASGALHVLKCLRVVCEEVRGSSKVGSSLLLIASQIEHVFLVVLPPPSHAGSCRWRPESEAVRAELLQLLHWCSEEYFAVCRSVPVAEEMQTSRMLTQMLLLSAFYQAVRTITPDGTKLDKVLPAMIEEERLTLKIEAPSGEKVSELLRQRCLLRPEQAEAASLAAQFLADVEGWGKGGQGAVYDVAFSGSGSKQGKVVVKSDSAVLDFVRRFNERYCSAGAEQFGPGQPPPNLAQIVGHGKAEHESAELHRLCAWLTLGSKAAESVDYGSSCRHLHWLRAMVFRCVFGVQYTHPGSGGGGQIYKTADVLFRCAFDKDVTEAEIAVDCCGGQIETRPYPYSPADPKCYLLSSQRRDVTEDDILHTEVLESFDDSISQEDSESLLSLLTAPYIRIPMVLEFFAADRVGVLLNNNLQRLFRAVLFDPGLWSRADDLPEIEKIPTPRATLATSRGALMAELERSPQSVLTPLLSLMREALRLSSDDCTSAFVDVLCFMVRMAARVQCYLRFLQSKGRGDVPVLQRLDVELAQSLVDAGAVLLTWAGQAAERGDKVVQSALHAHVASTQWPLLPERIDVVSASRLLSSICFVMTWHAPGVGIAPTEEEQAKSKAKAAEKQEQGAETEKELAALAKKGGLGGLCEQELFWLLTSKRQMLNAWLRREDAAEVEKVLSTTLLLVVENASVRWEMGPAGLGFVQDAAVIECVDANNEYRLNVQNAALSFKRTGLKPVPETIQLYSEFQDFFGEETPFCAEVSRYSNRHIVKVLSRNVLVEAWTPLQPAMFGLIPGAPTIQPPLRTEAVETKHPFLPDTKMSGAITIPGATSMTVSFDPRCRTERGCDILYLTLPGDKPTTRKLHGDSSEWETVCVEGDTIEYEWESDSKQYGEWSESWGWRMTVTEKIDLSSGEATVQYAGQSYGGPGRVHKYNDDAPSDAAWVLDILDPVLHGALTQMPRDGRGPLRWREVDGDGMQASELVYLFPTAPLPADASSCTLLSQHANGSYWREVRVWRGLRCVDVMVVDAFGRRAFPRQVYTSDVRFTLATAEYKDASEEAKSYPPPAAIRYQSGDMLCDPMGSRNALITDMSEPARPMLRVPKRFLEGVIPGALVENLVFWQDLVSGNLEGRRVVTERRDATGKMESFTDPWFDYTVDVQIGGAENSRIVRFEQDGQTRSLVNLKAVPPGSRECDLVRLVTRLDHLSHILAWTKAESETGADGAANSQIDLFELPRLGVHFEVKTVGDELRLFSLDRTGFFVLEDQSQLPAKLSLGLSNSLLLADSVGTLAFVVSNCPLLRPKIKYCPFSIKTYPQPCSWVWRERCEMRTFVYEVHCSNELVLFPSLGSTLYWAYSKLLHREYAAAYSALQSCCTDMELDSAESTFLGMFAHSLDDHSPDAHACRLKLRLALMYCPFEPSLWPVGGIEGLLADFASYLDKLCHVAAACRLSADEERQVADHLLQHCEDAKKHPAIVNRKTYLSAIEGETSAMAEQSEVEVSIFTPRQQDGGAFWAAAMVEASRSVRQYSTGNHWFSNATFAGTAERLSNGEVIKACDIARTDKMTGQKGYGYCFYAGIVAGHTKMMVGGLECSRSVALMLVKLTLLKACKWATKPLADEQVPFNLLVASCCAQRPLPRLPKLPKLVMAPTYRSSYTGGNMDLYDFIISHAKALGESLMLPAWTIHTPPPANRPSFTVARGGRRDLPVFVTDFSLASRALAAGPSLPESELHAFASEPLKSLVPFPEFVSSRKATATCPGTPPFDLSTHPDAQAEQAQELLNRLQEDWERYARSVNESDEIAVCGITPVLLTEYEDECHTAEELARARELAEAVWASEIDEKGCPIIRGSGQTPKPKPAFADTAIPKLCDLRRRLQLARERETDALNKATRSLVLRANSCRSSSKEKETERICFELLRFCALEPVLSAEYLVAVLVSSKGAEDMRRMNPYLSPEDVEALMNAVTVVVLRASRIAQLRRSIAAASDVLEGIEGRMDGRKLRKEVEGLVGALCGRRHFMDAVHDGKCRFDPRYLLFEYLFGWLLSSAQVYLVRTFMERLVHGGRNEHDDETNSMVHQMIMGAGKTTCIGPLLALMLSDGKALVTQVVPNHLLAMSRNVMWGRFTQILTKRVYTLVFTRSQAATEKDFLRLYEKMDRARRCGDVVVTTPSTIKSMFNKYVELLYTVKEAPERYTTEEDAYKAEKRSLELEEKIRAADALAQVMDLWSQRRGGVVLLDEVDVLLHPLHSELNFPIGNKYPLRPAPLRWELPMHLFFAVFFAGGRSMPAGRSAPPTLVHLREAVKAGIQQKLLQNTPHLVLLDTDYYHEAMLPLIAEWAVSWMTSHHVFEGIAKATVGKCKAYVMKGLSLEDDVLADLEDLSVDVLEVLNLANDWVTSYLPHALSKLNRVGYGLLHDTDLLGLAEQPASRLMLAVPFLGKDCPSPAAEFAQPDVLIAMSVLAYNYDGLRRSDVRGVIRQLKQQLHFQPGPVKDRPVNRTFEKWVEAACAVKRVPRSVLTLELTQLGDDREMERLFDLLHDSPEMISYHLLNMAFPQTMHQQRQKISSSGQELGSHILFGRRAGFSGTPSNLLPVELTPCFFEHGSEGRILRTLTDHTITTESPLGAAISEPGEQWTVRGILDQIAAADPPYHALIDVAALITGFSNEQVARYLVDTGLKAFRGCVFLDEQDNKMIYLRGAVKCIPLSECGLSVNERFTFFDQIHTTGTDIKQAMSACAVLTIGKDMTFRDYAQGAYRMRGIGKGQTIHLYVIPEVKLLIEKTLQDHFQGELAQDVAAWLLLNGIRMEKLQFLQLCTQNLSTIWRQRALDNLMTSSGIQGIPVSASRIARDVRGGLARFHSNGEQSEILRESVDKLVDFVDFDVPRCIPVQDSFVDGLQQLYQCNEGRLVTTEHQMKTKDIVFRQAEAATDVSVAEEAQTKLGSEMTREKEREQEQQKQKMQVQENDMEFAPSTSEQCPWAATLLFKPLAAAAAQNAPLYPLRVFSPRPKDVSRQDATGAAVSIKSVEPLAFPSSLFQTNNFADLNRDLTVPLRLKNVTLALDWVPNVANPVERASVVVTLSEAEAIRGLIHRYRKGMGTAAVALLMVNHNKVLDATEQYQPHAEGPMMSTEGSCLRFWNNEMFLTEKETQKVLAGLAEAQPNHRRAFFDAAIAARRRSKKTWVDTPIRKVFMFDDDGELMSMIALTVRLQEMIKREGYDLVKLCETIDVDGDGFLSIPELQRVLQHLDPTVSLPDLQRLVALMDEDGDNAIEYHEFEKLFSGGFTSAADGVTSLMTQGNNEGFKSLQRLSIFRAPSTISRVPSAGITRTASSAISPEKQANAARKRREREREQAAKRREYAAKKVQDEQARREIARKDQEEKQAAERRRLMEEQEKIQRQRAEEEAREAEERRKKREGEEEIRRRQEAEEEDAKRRREEEERLRCEREEEKLKQAEERRKREEEAEERRRREEKEAEDERRSRQAEVERLQRDSEEQKAKEAEEKRLLQAAEEARVRRARAERGSAITSSLPWRQPSPPQRTSPAMEITQPAPGSDVSGGARRSEQAGAASPLVSAGPARLTAPTSPESPPPADAKLEPEADPDAPTCSNSHVMTQQGRLRVPRAHVGGWECFVCHRRWMMTPPIWRCEQCQDLVCKTCTGILKAKAEPRYETPVQARLYKTPEQSTGLNWSEAQARLYISMP